MSEVQNSALLSASAVYKIIENSKTAKRPKLRKRQKSIPKISAGHIQKSSHQTENTNKNSNKVMKKRRVSFHSVEDEAEKQVFSNNLNSILKKKRKKVSKVDIDCSPELFSKAEQSMPTKSIVCAKNYFSYPNYSAYTDDDLFPKSSMENFMSNVNAKRKPRKEMKLMKKSGVQSTSPPTYRVFIKTIRRKLSEYVDSSKVGLKLFQFILGNTKVEDFFKNYWEKKHLLVKAERRIKFRGLFSTEELDNLLRENYISFGKNIDVTSYRDGVRETLNPVGRALAPVVWDFYNSGCSVRLLNPQTFSLSVWEFLSTLQEYFTSFCGANVYLTPPGTQGFAPHWDDIEAFILQLEGRKRWRVYEPRNDNEMLPRESSRNFGPDDLLGDPILDCVLEPGDLLYFPRGFIHQGEALDSHHSLHLTLSTYQKTSWVDLLEKVLPAALSNAAESDPEFREGLPRNYLQHGGIAFCDRKTKLRTKIFSKVNELVQRMLTDAPIDAAIDQLARGFIHDSLPPFLTESESFKSVFEGGEHWSSESKSVVNDDELEPEDKIRLLRRSCLRLVVEEDSIRLYYSIENSREYHEYEPAYLEIDPDMAPGVEFLINSYPNFTFIEELPLETLEKKMTLANALWEKGIILQEREEIDSDDV